MSTYAAMLACLVSLVDSKSALATECRGSDFGEVCLLPALNRDACDRLAKMTCNNDLGFGSGTKFVQPGQWFALPGPDGHLVGRCLCPFYYKRKVIYGPPAGGWGGWGGSGPTELQ